MALSYPKPEIPEIVGYSYAGMVLTVELRFPEPMVQIISPAVNTPVMANTDEGPIELVNYTWQNSTTLEMASETISDPGTFYSIEYTKTLIEAEQFKTLSGYIYPDFVAANPNP